LTWIQNTQFGIAKFQTPPGFKLFELSSQTLKSQSQNALRITLLMVEVIFWILWYIRTSICHRSLSWTLWTQITYQSCLAFWAWLEWGKLQIQLKTDRLESVIKPRFELIPPNIEIHSTYLHQKYEIPGLDTSIEISSGDYGKNAGIKMENGSKLADLKHHLQFMVP
jgi:hypothetical protein